MFKDIIPESLFGYNPLLSFFTDYSDLCSFPFPYYRRLTAQKKTAYSKDSLSAMSLQFSFIFTSFAAWSAAIQPSKIS